MSRSCKAANVRFWRKSDSSGGVGPSPLSSARWMSAAKIRSSDLAVLSPPAGRFAVFDRRFDGSAFDLFGQRLPSGLNRRHGLDEGLEGLG